MVDTEAFLQLIVARRDQSSTEERHKLVSFLRRYLGDAQHRHLQGMLDDAGITYLSPRSPIRPSPVRQCPRQPLRISPYRPGPLRVDSRRE